MGLQSWPGLFGVILAVVCFYGTTYLVIALTLGWRFGYWVAGSTFGALMVLLSIFWVQNPVGPRGEEARWVPIAAAQGKISQAKLKDQSLSSPSQYPSGPWASAAADDPQADALKSAVTTCITTKLEKLAEDDKEACTGAQKFMPPIESIPVIEGSAVPITPESTDIRLTTESGALLGEVTVVPTTHDPRLAKDPIKGKPMGDPFLLVAVYNKGSLRMPPFAALVLFSLFLAFHLAGLHRAEQRKLSPVAA